MLIDHLIYAHPDLDVGVSLLRERFGVTAAGGGQHPGRGTHNKLLALGPRTYLEVVAPDPHQPDPPSARPYGVEGVTDGGLVGWALAVDDIDAAAARAREQGFDPGPIVDGQRQTADGDVLRWRLTANAQKAGPIPFLIDWGTTRHPALDAPAGLGLVSLSLEHPEPTLLRAALAAMGADVDVRRAPRPRFVARITGPNGVLELH